MNEGGLYRKGRDRFSDADGFVSGLHLSEMHVK